ncbi:hypothetical protein QVD17_34082 [Tagetes erecta]|uniref:RING-type domain-containing protein n=1 Tax=Tagetes erecta TaxID=13708 RepID=A0AAD8JZG2_TARER|nr:hypothetical protein QVD17_34082 [Tagetes erecta]
MEETNTASSTSLTLGGILSIKQTPPYRVHDRTLLDLIRNDQTSGNESKKMWKMFRDKFRLKLAGAVCTTTDSIHTTTRNDTSTIRVISASPPLNDDTSSVPNTQTVIEQTELTEREQTVTEERRVTGGDGDGDGGEPTVARMSLMSLLEVEASIYMNDDDDDAAVEDSGDGGDGGGYNNCCVCMVRHKGAAFIPCGHTFCRHCSRELFVKRANCPLCNHFILEILDIF